MTLLDCSIACGISSLVVFCLWKSCEQEVELPPEEPTGIQVSEVTMTRV